jgi:hypothetical protein
VPRQIGLGGFTGTPIRGDHREFPHDQGFDVWNGRFLIIEVRSHVAYVRIGQADNLSRITWIGKDFLISGETSIENDFTTAPRDRSSGAPAENSPVFKRKNPWSYGCFCQRTLFPAGSK